MATIKNMRYIESRIEAIAKMVNEVADPWLNIEFGGFQIEFSKSEPFDHHSVTLSYSDAHCTQSISGLSFLKFNSRRLNNSGS